MAVTADQRGRGVGAHVLTAAEAIASAAGEHDICLHLRFQDADGAPGRLYERAGFVRVKADSCLVWLLGQDRRYLLRKELKPQATAAAALQQQQRDAGGEGAAAA